MPDAGDQTGAGQDANGPDADRPGEPVGSLAEEAARLMAAMMTGGGAGSDPRPGTAGDDGAGTAAHTCPHGWCPICQVAEYVQEHPEIVTQVLVAGAEFLQVVRDAVTKVTGPDEEPE